jgi:hypothetical protein
MLPDVDHPQLVGDVGDIGLSEDTDMTGPAGGLDVTGANDVLNAVQRLAKSPGDLPDCGECGG